MAEETLHLLVRGKVQGVGFRWFVASEARRLALRGWVRNNADGSVEVCARGPAADIQSLESRLRTGPEGAHVSGIDRVSDDVALDLEAPFRISRA